MKITSSVGRSPRKVKKARVVLCGLLVSLCLAVSLAPPLSMAESMPPMMGIAYQNGTITAIFESTFQIDRRTYSLTPDVVILDDKGHEVGPDVLVVTAEVKFHVKKEQNDKIDRIIVFLPR